MSDVYQLVYEMIDAQYAVNTSMSLPSVANLKLRLNADTRVLERVYDNRKEIIKVLGMKQDPQLQSIIDYMTVRTRKSIYHLNQFVQLTGEDEIVLRRLYARLVQESVRCLQSADGLDALRDSIAGVVASHSSMLVRHLTTMRDSDLIASLAPRPVCAEYSPALQLRVLGLSRRLHTLKEPILDMGCGKGGSLVFHLRSLGFEAVGIDRDVEESPYMMEADWTSLPLGTREWGTILSHMAFSNHFRHHHLRRDGRPEHYARLYMRILEALDDGGSFFYAPDLPFMERLLPSQRYTVRRVLVDPYAGLYSTQVTRQ